MSLLAEHQAAAVAAARESTALALAQQARIDTLQEAAAARERYLPELLRLAVTLHPRYLADAVDALRTLPSGTEG